MKLLKPSWVHHDEKPIFSVDVHHECGKFATGGQGSDSGLVVIWNLKPVLSEKAELDASVPKVLCRMDNHLACVNCVRWSQSGLMLASGSDDKLVMIWRQSKGGSQFFDSGGIRKDPESWKCAYTLRGHSGDVLDMAWSPQDRWLASCSIDNTVIIWDVHNFPVMMAMLKGHTGLVKGVAWDPVGKFLASQSDDRTVKIWKTSDWTCSNTITEPFEECGGTTHILRLSWSPDGQYLVSAHAMNGGGPTAQIIEREGWKCDKDFVGHRKAVTCVRFHNSILKRQTAKGQKAQQYCCLAVGSRDRSLSVWMTALQRPLLVIHELFNDSILDLSWGPQKCILMACSGDGTVACLQFSEQELGTPLSEEDRNLLYQRIYGKNAGVLANGGSNMVLVADDMIVEHSELLEYVQDKVKAPTLLPPPASTTTNNTTTTTAAPSPHSLLPSKSSPLLSSSANGFLREEQNATFGKQQVETRAADGKRRITPIFIPKATINSDFNSNSMCLLKSDEQQQQVGGEEEMEEGEREAEDDEPPQSKIQVTTTIKRNNNPSGITLLENTTNNSGGVNNGSTTLMRSGTTTTTTTNEQPLNEAVKKSNNNSQSLQSNGGVQHTHTITTITNNNNHCRLDSRLAASSSNNNSSGKPLLSQPLSVNAQNLPTFPSFQQQQSAAAMPSCSSSSTSNRLPLVVTTREDEEETQRRPPRVYQASTIAPKLQITNNTRCEFQKTALGLRVHVHNGFQQTANGFLAKVTAFRLGSGKLWESFVGSPLINLNFCTRYVMLCSLDGTLRLLELQTGRPLMPIMSMTSLATQCAFCPSGSLVGVCTESGQLRVWRVKSCTAVLAISCAELLEKNGGAILQLHLTEQAVPLILCANGHAYSYSKPLQTWLVVNSNDPITHCGLQASIPKTFTGSFASYPLTSVQAATSHLTASSTAIDLNENDWQGLAKIIFIENQIKLCEAVNSPEELKHWYKLLVYHLAMAGNETKIRLILNELLSGWTRSDKSSLPNSTSSSNPSSPSTHILNISKQELLELVLNQLKAHIKCQRIYMEYVELFESFRATLDQEQQQQQQQKSPSPSPPEQ